MKEYDTVYCVRFALSTGILKGILVEMNPENATKAFCRCKFIGTSTQYFRKTEVFSSIEDAYLYLEKKAREEKLKIDMNLQKILNRELKIIK